MGQLAERAAETSLNIIMKNTLAAVCVFHAERALIPPVILFDFTKLRVQVLLPPQGFRPEGEIPRRHSSNSRVY